MNNSGQLSALRALVSKSGSLLLELAVYTKESCNELPVPLELINSSVGWAFFHFFLLFFLFFPVFGFFFSIFFLSHKGESKRIFVSYPSGS